jgi:hypothetical protein
MNMLAIKNWEEWENRIPAHPIVADVDLVGVRFYESFSVLYGRCAQWGALISDGFGTFAGVSPSPLDTVLRCCPWTPPD